MVRVKTVLDGAVKCIRHGNTEIGICAPLPYFFNIWQNLNRKSEKAITTPNYGVHF